MIADQATPATLICVDHRRFHGLSRSFQPLCQSVLANPSIPWSECPGTCAELIRSTRIFNLSAPFPRSKKRQDSTSPREVRRGWFVALFPLFPPRVRHALGWLAPAGPLASSSSFNRSLYAENHYGSSIKIRNRPIRPRYLLIPEYDSNRFTSRWDFGRKLKPSRPFSTSSRPRTKSILLRCSAWKRKSTTPFTSSNPSCEKRTDLCPQIDRPRRPRLGIS